MLFSHCVCIANSDEVDSACALGKNSIRQNLSVKIQFQVNQTAHALVWKKEERRERSPLGLKPSVLLM